MAVTDTQLLLRLSADVQKFQKQMARITAAGQATAVETEARFRSAHGQMAKSAEKSADAIGREMDRLRTKYDPVYAASKKYETALDELNRAQKVGALSAVQHEAALERLNAEYAASSGMTQRAAASTTALAAANTRVATTSRGMGGGIQNASFQIADFATQVGAGTAASVALGQQLPQMLGGIGVLGAVLGAVVAVGVPVASMLIRTGDAGETMQDKIDTLKSAVDDYTAASERAFIPTAELAEKYGAATGAAREFIAALQNISQVDALNAVSSTLDGIVESLGSFFQVRAQAGTLAGIDSIEVLGEDLGVAAHNAGEVAARFRDIGRAEGPQAQIGAIQALLRALEDALGPYDDMKAAAKEVYTTLTEAGDQLAEMVSVGNSAADAIGGAASEAGRLADELARAVGNAMDLAAQGINDELRAKIEFETRADPIARARELASARFNEQVPRGQGGPIEAVIDKQREAFVAASVGAEEYRQKLKAWQDQQREAAKAASAGGSSGRKGRKGREEPGLFEASDEELLSIERRMEMMGREASEVAGLNAKYALLDEAKRRGLALDAEVANTGETLREQIERQAGAIERLSETYDGAKMRADFFADAQRTVQDGMIDAIVEGENLAGVLGNVAKMFARAAIEASLFGQGGLGNDGGGLLGGVLAGLGGLGGGGKPLDAAGVMSSGRAAGGPVTAGKMYRVNEHGGGRQVEAFVPGVNGRVLSLAQTQQMQGQGGAPISVSYAPVIDARNMAAEDVRRLETVIAQDRAAFSARVVETLAKTGRYGVSRNVLRRG